MGHRKYLALEFVLLCIALPTVIIVFRLAPYMLFFLWAAWAVCWSVYRHYHYRELKTLWRWKSVTWRHMKPILVRWAVCVVLMIIFTVYYDPERLFYLLKEKPEILPFLMVLYPVFYARHRYRRQPAVHRLCCRYRFDGRCAGAIHIYEPPEMAACAAFGLCCGNRRALRAKLTRRPRNTSQGR